MRYPLGQYYDDVFNLQVVRNGTVASAYPMRFRGQPYFLIDARLHEGTSGSPVNSSSVPTMPTVCAMLNMSEVPTSNTISDLYRR